MYIMCVFQTGHAIAPVANCCHTKYSSQVKEDMSVKEFCDYWRNRSQGIIVTCCILFSFWSFLCSYIQILHQM